MNVANRPSPGGAHMNDANRPAPGPRAGLRPVQVLLLALSGATWAACGEAGPPADDPVGVPTVTVEPRLTLRGPSAGSPTWPSPPATPSTSWTGPNGACRSSVRTARSCGASAAPVRVRESWSAPAISSGVPTGCSGSPT